MVHENHHFEYATRKPHFLSNQKFQNRAFNHLSLSGSTLPVQPPNKNSFVQFNQNHDFVRFLRNNHLVTFARIGLQSIDSGVEKFGDQGENSGWGNTEYGIPLEPFTYNGYAQIAFLSYYLVYVTYLCVLRLLNLYIVTV